MGAFSQIAQKDILKAVQNKGLSSTCPQDTFATKAKGKYLVYLSWSAKLSFFLHCFAAKRKAKNMSLTSLVSMFLVHEEGNRRTGNIQLLSLIVDTLLLILSNI